MTTQGSWLDRLLPGRSARREAERELAIRRARRNVERHVVDQRSAAVRLWDLAGRALAMEDRFQFDRIGRQYLSTIDDIRRWERYAVALEALTLRREQANSAAVFLLALQSLGAGVLAGTDAAAAARIERELADGAARASDVTDALDRLLVQTERTVDAMGHVRGLEAEPLLVALESAIGERTGQSTATDQALDVRIEEGLRLLAEEAGQKRGMIESVADGSPAPGGMT